MEELLIESWVVPVEVLNSDQISSLTESKDLDPKALYIQGVFLQADVINGNRRLYPKRILEKAVDNYIKEQITPRQSLGELNHPARPFADPTKSCLIIEKLWWEGNNVMGIARIVTGDYAEGDKVAALIRAGWIPGVSSRGLGRVVNKGSYNEVQDGFKLTVGVDIVWGPSAPNAFVKAITENKESSEDSEKIVSEKVINKTNDNDHAKTIVEALQKFKKKNEDAKQMTSLAERVKQHFQK